MLPAAGQARTRLSGHHLSVALCILRGLPFRILRPFFISGFFVLVCFVRLFGLACWSQAALGRGPSVSLAAQPRASHTVSLTHPPQFPYQRDGSPTGTCLPAGVMVGSTGTVHVKCPAGCPAGAAVVVMLVMTLLWLLFPPSFISLSFIYF